MTKLIELANSRGSTLVDDEDFEIINQFSWHIATGGYARSRFPSTEKGKQGKPIYLHRLVLGLQPGDKTQVDHINQDRLDNRRSNLRPCSPSQNKMNRPKPRYLNPSSRYKGVCWDKQKGKWMAYCGFGGHHKTIGHFSDEQKAAIAYNEYVLKHCSEFAHLNQV